MLKNRNKLYIFLMTACLAGYIWLYWTINNDTNSVSLCLFKHITGIPCPSCGSTRSVISLIKGNLSESFWFNPFGLIIAGIMLVAPAWILLDTLTGKSTFLKFYLTTESTIKKPFFAIMLTSLVLANWIWNVIKGL